MYNTCWPNGQNKMLQMCTVKIETGLRYKSSKIPSPAVSSPSPSPPKIELSPDSSATPTSLERTLLTNTEKFDKKCTIS